MKSEYEARLQVERALHNIKVMMDRSEWDAVADIAEAVASIGQEVHEGIEREVEDIGQRGR